MQNVWLCVKHLYVEGTAEMYGCLQKKNVCRASARQIPRGAASEDIETATNPTSGFTLPSASAAKPTAKPEPLHPTP